MARVISQRRVFYRGGNENAPPSTTACIQVTYHRPGSIGLDIQLAVGPSSSQASRTRGFYSRSSNDSPLCADKDSVQWPATVPKLRGWKTVCAAKVGASAHRTGCERVSDVLRTCRKTEIGQRGDLGRQSVEDVPRNQSLRHASGRSRLQATAYKENQSLRRASGRSRWQVSGCARV